MIPQIEHYLARREAVFRANHLHWQDLLAGRRLGPVQRAGAWAFTPVLDDSVAAGTFACLSPALLRCGAEAAFVNQADRPLVVPLHLICGGSPSLALSSACLLAPRERLPLAGAAEVPAIGAPLALLPLALRAAAWDLHAIEGAGKFAAALLREPVQPCDTGGWPALLPGQTGLVVHRDGVWLGLELAPDAANWAVLHQHVLRSYCLRPPLNPDPGLPGGLGLRLRWQRGIDRLADLRAGALAGQALWHGGQVAYASLFAYAWQYPQTKPPHLSDEGDVQR